MKNAPGSENGPGACPSVLLTKTKLCDQCTVSFDVVLLQILEKSSSLTDHLQKASSGMMILRVLLQVLGELRDPCGQHRDLNFR